MPRLVSYPARLRALADADPDHPAVTCGDAALTRAELDVAADALARELRDLGVGVGDMVTIALPNSVDWFVAVVAAWKLGATPQPVSARLPGRELEAVVELADPKVVLGVDPAALPDRTCRPVGHVAPPAPAGAEPLPDVVSPAWKAPTSGGSTGRPKLIVTADPALVDADAEPVLLLGREGVTIVPGPLYHNGPLIWSCHTLLAGGHVVLQERFDAEGVLALIERHRGTVAYLVPTMMKRIWRLPEEVRDRYDLSSLRLVWHLAEPCPPWLKDAWIGWLGPERIIELYGGTEGQMSTIITGEEWLAHRGSVGRPFSGQVSIRDADGNEVPVGEEGEVWLRSDTGRTTYRYVGAEARTLDGGWESLGDMGRVDAEGYLYLGDRAKDMVLIGGANVYPAEVESALQEHPLVRSCVVIGLPDDDKGHVLHAIVEPDPGGVEPDELRAFVAERLVSYKIPRTWEFVDEALRDDAGKVRRSMLRDSRLG